MTPSASPIPALVQKQQQDWQQRVERLARLAVEEDKRALEMGDEFLEIEEIFGKDLVVRAAAQSGIKCATARQRVNISRKIPKGHYLRETQLSYSHLRVLTYAEDEEKMEAWGKRAIDNSWTVEELDEAMKQEGDVQAQSMGIPCTNPACGRLIESKEEMISFSRLGEKRGRLCSVKCARDYFAWLLDCGNTLEESVEQEAGALSEEEPLRERSNGRKTLVTPEAVYSIFDRREDPSPTGVTS
jgi:hypothetical protein